MAWEAQCMKVECVIGTLTLNTLNQHLTECIYTVTNNICCLCHLWLAADMPHVVYMVHN